MKKTTKLLAVILAIVTIMSSFSIMSSAVNSKSSAKELLDYYEDCIITTSAKEDAVRANETYKKRSTADYSVLKGKDLEETKLANDVTGYGNGKWQEEKWTEYYYGDAYEEFYWEGRSDFIDTFSIKRDIRRSNLKFKSAKYSKAENGDVTLTFVYLSEYNECTSTWTYTIKINKSNYVKSYLLNKSELYVEYSADGNPYSVDHETVDVYSFTYSKVDVKAIELSEKKVVLGKDEERIITAVVKPDNATFKDIYISDDVDYSIAGVFVRENGEIEIIAHEPGKTSFDVCAYSGEVVETVEVVVEYSFIDTVKELLEEFLEKYYLLFSWMFIWNLI